MGKINEASCLGGRTARFVLSVKALLPASSHISVVAVHLVLAHAVRQATQISNKMEQACRQILERRDLTGYLTVQSDPPSFTNLETDFKPDW